MTDGPLDLLTASRAKAFRACQRQHHYAYEFGVRPLRDASALRFGTLIHAGLEAWWKWWQAWGQDSARADASPLDAAIEALTAARRAVTEYEADAFEHARLVALLCGYDAAWSSWAREVEVLGVEVKFRLPLLHPVTGRPAKRWGLSGKLDGLLRLPDGRIAVLEHKTSGDDDVGPGSAYRTRLTLDGQVSQYFDGADALGYPADVCVYDVLVKPAQKPLKATENPRFKKDGTPYANVRLQDETPEEYLQRLTDALAEAPEDSFQHAEIVRLEEEREQFKWNAWHTVRAIEEARRAGYTIQNGDACFRYGSPCAYWDVCSGVVSIDDPMRFKRLANIHPELSEPAEVQG